MIIFLKYIVCYEDGSEMHIALKIKWRSRPLFVLLIHEKATQKKFCLAHKNRSWNIVKSWEILARLLGSQIC